MSQTDLALDVIRRKVFFHNSVDVWISACEEKKIHWNNTENYKKFIEYLLKNNLQLKAFNLCAHEAGATDTNDKTTKSADNETGSGLDVTINMNPSMGTEILAGLNIFAGYSDIEQTSDVGDRKQEAFGFTYAIGGATIGWQTSKDDNPGAANEYYDNTAYGVSFAVNDNLSAIICCTLLESSVFNSSGVSASINFSHSGAAPVRSLHEPAMAIGANSFVLVPGLMPPP